jgi:hypothetical protein
VLARHAAFAQAREILARPDAAPADRLSAASRQDRVQEAVLELRLQSGAVGRTLAGIPGLAALSHPPPLAPAASRRAVGAEQGLDH